MDDLQVRVRDELQRRKGDWPQIARDVPVVSYSFIQKVGNGSYKAAPTYRRLRALFDYFQANPLPPAPHGASQISSSHTATETVAGTTTA